ncbi:MAG: methionyl-tRNA formyltransferase [Ignavibacteriae bacterium]|nr:methionyl-tRNA formyltransferase [Ignavibacteriota bacterium]
MGTPDFAVPSLKALLASRHTIAAVVTAPDEARGRGQKVTPTPVKVVAEAAGLPVLQPESLKDPTFATALSSIPHDVIVVVAFRILPPSVYTLAPLGAFNLHASLLPLYRGAAPINWALMNGESETGVTTFFLQEKVDTGAILRQSRIPIGPDTNAGQLHDALAILGASEVVETVEMIARGDARALPQSDTLATPAPKIFRDTCRIDWARDAASVHNHVRGLSPYPAAWTTLNGETIKVYQTRIDAAQRAEPGCVTADKHHIYVSCADRDLEILALKQEGRKLLEADVFLRGFSFEEGARFQ